MPDFPEALGADGYEPDAVKAVSQADIIGLLRVQRERQEAGLFPSVREYHSIYGADSELLARARRGAVVIHPAPINRGVEVSSELADSGSSLIREQVRCGVLVRMALMDICLGGGAQ